ncbi:unnamed protein product [Rangifer tarandus platyrhynchus]|uniref:Uncharacterized protein n=2 Tax=Rangifer tarandus platyrhynchus TaxID=3082113 RepID=A0ABN9A264_RANTA|nr:unnamed protein product [Rangifer tarandus platyrhynchus]
MVAQELNRADITMHAFFIGMLILHRAMTFLKASGEPPESPRHSVSLGRLSVQSRTLDTLSLGVSRVKRGFCLLLFCGPPPPSQSLPEPRPRFSPVWLSEPLSLKFAACSVHFRHPTAEEKRLQPSFISGGMS